jgi:uncharacterized caspase-like protein
LDQRGTLYLIAVGVDKYLHLPAMCSGPEGSCELKFAGADARQFAEAIAEGSNAFFDKLRIRVLHNDDATPENLPTHDNIVATLKQFETAKPTENDAVIVFLLGQGVNEDGDDGRKRHDFLPADARSCQGGSWGAANGVDWSPIGKALANVNGRRMVFLDTCHAANFLQSRDREEFA